MPWTLSIARRDNGPLGDLQGVHEAIVQALPQTKFWRDPSGAEKAALIPEDSRGLFLQLFGHLPADERGIYEQDRITLEFFLGSQPVVDSLTIDVRGRGNPIPLLRRLCEPLGWCVHDSSGEQVDLQQPAAPGWDAFSAYRDEAVEKIDGGRASGG